MISLGNTEAFTVLSGFLKDLPPPKTIQEVHFRRDILRYLRRSKAKDENDPGTVKARKRENE
jgi:hypothetical protein